MDTLDQIHKRVLDRTLDALGISRDINNLSSDDKFKIEIIAQITFLYAMSTMTLGYDEVDRVVRQAVETMKWIHEESEKAISSRMN